MIERQSMAPLSGGAIGAVSRPVLAGVCDADHPVPPVLYLVFA